MEASERPLTTQGWSLEELGRISENFQHVQRVPLAEAQLRLAEIEIAGEPAIIEGLHQHSSWPTVMFNVSWLSQHGPKDINVRNICTRTDSRIPFDEFISKSRSTPACRQVGEPERLYGKDAECPAEWSSWLHETDVVPRELLPDTDQNLLHLQPQPLRVETLMCYLGIGDTYTPCHKDLCASSGQNLMCYTEEGGSSFWMMTRSSDALEVSKYFHSLRQELDHECHVITLDQLAKAPFKVYIAEQRLGDLVLVPPRSCHQVINYGGITIKTSWSRLHLRGLETAFYHELPIYRRVCRPEIYRVKSTLFHALLLETERLEGGTDEDRTLRENTRLQTLLRIFDDLLLDEYTPEHSEITCLSTVGDVIPDLIDASIQVVCDFCGADIFQSFFECRECVVIHGPTTRPIGPGDGYTICAGCYVEGRSCSCDNMEPVQCRPFAELLEHRERAASVLLGDEPTRMWKTDHYLSGGTFKAACILHKRKKVKRDIRTCKAKSGGENHPVPYAWALSCKKCHNGKCFRHILINFKLHVINAVLLFDDDDSHHAYHTYHCDSSKKYEAWLSALSLVRGDDSGMQRVYNALTYPLCEPINSIFSSLGFYDRRRRNIPNKQTLPLELSSLSGPFLFSEFSVQPSSIRNDSRFSSPLTSITSTSSASSTPFVGTFQGGERPRLRIVLDYVQVPAAPYKIKSAIPGLPKQQATQDQNGRNCCSASSCSSPLSDVPSSDLESLPLHETITPNCQSQTAMILADLVPPTAVPP